MNGNGRAGGGTASLYVDIIRRGFPDDFRVECYNCNCGAFRNGGVCPHVRAKLVTVTPDCDVLKSLYPAASPETLISASGPC